MWLVSLVAIIYVCTSELAHAQPRYEILYNWYRSEQENDIRQADNFTTTHPSWHGQVGDQRSGYELFRIEGRVFHRDAPQPPGTVPLFGWYSHGRRDNFLTSDPRWCGDARFCANPVQRQLGYEFVRVEGFVYDPLQQPPQGTWPLYRWYDPDREDNLATTDRRWAGTVGVPNEARNYGFARREGYLDPSLFSNSHVDVPVFFHFVHDRTNPTTGLPAYRRDGVDETMIEVDDAMLKANRKLYAAKGMDNRRLRLIRVGVRYVNLVNAARDSGCVQPEGTIGSARMPGALNVVLTASCGGGTVSPSSLRAAAPSLLHEAGHALGLRHPFEGNLDFNAVEYLLRDFRAESEDSCYRRGDRVCDTPPDYGFAKENGDLDWVECDGPIVAPCVQTGLPCDLSEPVIDGRGLCRPSGELTYDPIKLELQLGKPTNVMAYHTQDVLTYEQFLRMHGYAQWRRGRKESVPPDEQFIIRGLWGVPEWIWDGVPDGNQFLHDLGSFDRTMRFFLPRDLRQGIIDEHFQVPAAWLTSHSAMPSQPYLLMVRAEARGNGRASGSAVLDLISPEGFRARLTGSQLHADDGLLVADEIYASEVLGTLRWRRADGVWRVLIEDPGGSLVSRKRASHDTRERYAGTSMELCAS
jgi:hypothetical protein